MHCLSACICPSCSASVAVVPGAGETARCHYCGTAFIRSRSTPPPLPQPVQSNRDCECGHAGINHCVICRKAICDGCTREIKSYDLPEILGAHSVPRSDHGYWINRLVNRLDVRAALCVACLDETLTGWLDTITENHA